MAYLASVVIPVKNGDEFLDEVLQQVLSQKTDFAYEVIVIDSGSTDRSLEIIKNYDVNLIQIDAKKFNHGLTRNLGVQKSSGEFIAFVTQDATPVNDQWLQNLVMPL
ncbi:MAG: glycosyltransferase family 2 protein, partial [Waterburya sp.]